MPPLTVSVMLAGQVPSSAHAQPARMAAHDNRPAARALADKGFELYQAGQYHEALQSFSEAEQLFSAPTLRLMIARCQDKLGQLLEARDTYRSIQGEALGPGAPPEFVQAKKDAAEALDALATRIPTVSVTVIGAPALEVHLTLDGVALDQGRPVERNPGEHTVEAQTPGREPVIQTVRLAEGSRAELNLHFLVTPAAPAPLAPLAPRASVDPAGTPNKVVIVGGIGLSATLVGLGIGLFAAGAAKASEADDACTSTCPAPADQMKWKEASQVGADLKNGAVWSFIGAGLVGLGTAGYTFWWPRTQAAGATARARLMVRPGMLVVSRSW